MLTVEKAREIRRKWRLSTEEELEALMQYIGHVEWKLSQARGENQKLKERLEDIEALG